VHLTPTEEARLLIFSAAELARSVRQRGLGLSAPEAVAIICDEMHMAARSGASFEEVQAAGRSAVTAGDLMDGVPDLVTEIRLEVVLDEGSRLVVLRDLWT
jgi:urease subunit gamma/beta